MTSAPTAVIDNDRGFGTECELTSVPAVQSVANPGISKIAASTMPTRARRVADKRNAASGMSHKWHYSDFGDSRRK